MVVYADILITLNLLVDYFLILLTAKILRKNPPIWRILLASVVSALSSLYIFFPPAPAMAELAVKAVLCAVITLICFGFGSVKIFFRSSAVFLGVSFLYAGAMLAFWYVFRPYGMLVHNSVVYFDVSPVFLIVFSVVGYLVTFFLKKLLGKNGNTAAECDVTVTAGKQRVEIRAIVDTGNSIEDVFSSAEIIIAEERYVNSLFGEMRDAEGIKSRYRILPCNTVNGGGLLEGYRCDSAYISCDGRTTVLTKPIIAISKEPLGGDYGAIINPKSIE